MKQSRQRWTDDKARRDAERKKGVSKVFQGGQSRQEPQTTGWAQEVTGGWFKVAIQPERPTHTENRGTHQGHGGDTQEQNQHDDGGQQAGQGQHHGGGRGITGNGEVHPDGGEMTLDKTMLKESGGKTSGENGTGSPKLRPYLPQLPQAVPRRRKEGGDETSHMQTQFGVDFILGGPKSSSCRRPQPSRRGRRT